VIDQGQLADHARETANEEFQRSARRHDCEASLLDRFAAETGGCLHFAFLHAAEAYRAAAQQDRALAAGVGLGQQVG
jgi:hypothetical protein